MQVLQNPFDMSTPGPSSSSLPRNESGHANKQANQNKAPLPQEPPRGTKRAKKNQAQKPHLKKAKTDAAVQQALRELSTWTHDLQSAPRGQDFPGGRIINKVWNGRKNCDLVTYQRVGSAGVQLESLTVPQVWEGWRVRIDLDSQAPGILLSKSDIEIRITVRNIRLKNFAEHGDNVFNESSICRSSLNVVNVQKAFSEALQTPNLSDDQAEKLTAFGASPSPENVGINCLQFVLRGKMHAEFRKASLKKEDREKQLADAKDVLKAMNSNAVFTLVRKTSSVRKELDDYWKHRVRICVDKKICPFFNDEVSNTGGYAFKKFLDDPERKLSHQPWMANPSDLTSVAELKTYASHAARRKFDEGRHWEIILSAALMHEIEYENICLTKYFRFGIDHEAKVIRRSGQYVQLEVSVFRHSEQFAMPTLTVNTKMKLHTGKLIVEKDDMVDEEAPRKEDVEMAGYSQVYSGYEYRAKVLSKETTKAFVVSLFFDKRDKDADAKFGLNNRVTIQLEMKRNHVPSDRQLAAIGLIARADKNESLSAHEKTFAQYLHRFMLGEGAPDLIDAKSPIDEKSNELTEEVWNGFNDWAYSVSLNTEQSEAWTSIFLGTNMFTQVQGPPGTGKTRLNVMSILCFALLGYRTVITAPTNKACEATMKALISELAGLYTVFPAAKTLFKIVHFPTSATLTDQLLYPDNEAESNVEADVWDMYNEGVDGVNALRQDLKRYQLWSHIEDHFIDIVEKGKAAPQTAADANKWLDTHHNLHTNSKISLEEKKQFLKLGRDAAEEVCKDPLVKIVVTTSNNADQLREMGYKCEALIIDECAFGTEHDTCVPLSLNAQWVILTGDHQQLKPIVQSKLHNEYASQLGLSLFERVLGQDNIPLFRLKVNYRMHPDIALLPGILGYEWLGCGDNTTKPNEEMEAVDTSIETWWNSKAALKYRRNRRQPLFGRKSSGSIRRLFFNVEGAVSACPPNSTSTVNFANVVALVDVVVSILEEAEQSGKFLDVNLISILTPYNEQKEELAKYIRLYMSTMGYTKFPSVLTIDSMQGGENAVIILDLTAANPNHGSSVGFMQTWNRLNVALTRAQRYLFMVGNIDVWCSELIILGGPYRARKLCYLIMDLLELGDIINVKNIPNALPADKEELERRGRAEWSLKTPQPRVSRLSDKLEAMASAYKADAKVRDIYEEKLINELNRKRSTAANFQRLYDDGQHFETNLNTTEELTGAENNEAESFDADCANDDNNSLDLDVTIENSTDPIFEEATKRSLDPKEQVDAADFTVEQFKEFQL